jgi:putative transposase
MWHAARRAGLALGRDQVGRLMRMAGVQGNVLAFSLFGV